MSWLESLDDEEFRRRQAGVCVCVATIASQVNFQNDALMPSLINLIKRCSRNRQVCYA